MSLTSGELKPAGAPAEADSACPQCGTELAAEQEWCLECGAARTLIHRPPDWRLPFAIVGVVIALVVAGFGIALVNLSGSANDNTRTLPRTPPTTAPVASKPQPPPVPLGGWPVGLSGWTVILFKSHDKATADARARKLAGGGLSVGVLDSSRHPSMIPGYWVVFSGRYPDQARAKVAALRLKADGNARARARRVARPGGL